MDESAVLYTSPSGGVNMCTRTAPCTINWAFYLADATRQTVKMLPGTYAASLTISDKTIVVHGYGATINAAAGARMIELGSGARLRLLGVTLVNINSGDNGIVLDCYPGGTPAVTPSVELDQVTIDATNTPLVAYPCTATISRSRLITRSSSAPIVYVLPTSSVTIDRSVLEGGGGVQSEGSASVARITNSVIRNAQGATGAFAGTNTFGAGFGSVFVSFSTVIDSPVMCSSGSPRCAGGNDLGSCMDNVIVFNGVTNAPVDTVQPGGCTASHSIIYPQSTALTGTNNKYGVNPMFTDFAGADYHLAPGSPAIDAADPAASNAVDLEGVTRPQGARNDIGAFEYKP